MQATKPSDQETLLLRTFAAPRPAVFDALTRPDRIVEWMKPSHMSLAGCEIDLRAGGSLRYVFQRPNGRKLEVRGTIESVDPPRSLVYRETYDFSPLVVLVSTTLDEAAGGTIFRQTLGYASRQERDGDFDGVAGSAAEVYEGLARYLTSG
jgi:uncharacterized protein YndB with AHSA1/START domain